MYIENIHEVSCDEEHAPLFIQLGCEHTYMWDTQSMMSNVVNNGCIHT